MIVWIIVALECNFRKQVHFVLHAWKYSAIAVCNPGSPRATLHSLSGHCCRGLLVTSKRLPGIVSVYCFHYPDECTVGEIRKIFPNFTVERSWHVETGLNNKSLRYTIVLWTCIRVAILKNHELYCFTPSTSDCVVQTNRLLLWSSFY